MPKGKGYSKYGMKDKDKKRGIKIARKAKKELQKLAEKAGKMQSDKGMNKPRVKIYKHTKEGKTTYYSPETGESTQGGPVEGRKVMRRGMEKRTARKVKEAMKIRRLENEKGISERLKSGFGKIENYED